jgi:hypothetical protein
MFASRERLVRRYKIMYCVTRAAKEVDMLVSGGPAPYAPANAVALVIRAKRQDPSMYVFGPEELAKVGVRESVIPRTIQALRVLDFIDDDDVTTRDFDEIGTLPTDASRAKLQRMLKKAYAPIFEEVDPITAPADVIEAAFEGFTPASQSSRMVSLLIGLLEASGLREKGKDRDAEAAATPVAQGRRLTGRPRPSESLANKALTRHVVPLASGGSVSIALDVNLFELSREDREFVLSLIDEVKSYPRKTSNP